MTESKDSPHLAEWSERAHRFQGAFKEFLTPRDDLEECGHLAKFLAVRFWGNPLQVINRKDAVSDLDSLRACLNFIHQAAIIDLEGPSPPELKDLADAVRALHAATPESIDAYCAMLAFRIEQTPNRGNINWHSVYGVDCLRQLWRVMRDKIAPSRALNPSSEFSRFLRAGFQYLEIDADPLSAFKRWAEEWPPRDRD